MTDSTALVDGVVGDLTAAAKLRAKVWELVRTHERYNCLLCKFCPQSSASQHVVVALPDATSERHSELRGSHRQFKHRR